MRTWMLQGLRQLQATVFPRDFVAGTFQSLVVTAAAAATSFAMLWVMARAMDASDFGHTVTWLNALSFGAVAAAFGQELMFVSTWNDLVHQKQYGAARGLLIFGLAVCAIGALLAATVVFGTATFLGQPNDLVAGLILFVVAQTFCLVSSHWARITRGIVSGVVHREVTWRALVITSIAALTYFGFVFSSHLFFVISAIGLFGAVAFQIHSTLTAIPAPVKTATAEIPGRSWIAKSARFWTAGLIEAASQYLDVVLIAALLSPRLAGIYFVASKLASLFLVLADALTLFSSRRIAFLYYKPDLPSLERTLRQVSGLCSAFVLIGLIVVAMFGAELLGLFGAEYGDSKSVLILLCLGTSAMALAGPSAQLLLLTGHELAYVSALAVITGLRYLLIAGGTHFVGLVGAAAAAAISMIALSIVLVVLSRRRVGLDPSAFSIIPMVRVTLPSR